LSCKASFTLREVTRLHVRMREMLSRSDDEAMMARSTMIKLVCSIAFRFT
jgi:hypothetical protein